MPTTLHYIRGRFRSHVKTQAKVHSRGKSRTTWGCKLQSIGSSWATKTMASNEQMEKIGTFNSEHFDLHERGGVTFSPSALARKALRRDTHRRRPWPSSTTNAAIFLHYPPSPLKSRLHHFRQRRLLALSAVAASLPPPSPSPHPTVPLRFRPLLQLPHFGPPVANTTLPSNVNCFSSITFICRGLPIPNFVCFPPILS